MSDVLVLEIDSIPGNCEIEKFKGKIIVNSYSHSVSLPLSMASFLAFS